jgi:hypothetical protein
MTVAEARRVWLYATIARRQHQRRLSPKHPELAVPFSRCSDGTLLGLWEAECAAIKAYEEASHAATCFT